MATRAHIIVQRKPDEFAVIYTHSDGYPSWNGVLLDRFHRSHEAAVALTQHGHCSVIDVRVAPEPGEEHGFDREKRAAFCCIYYMRDRGDTEGGTYVCGSLVEALKYADECYVYLWLLNGDGWMVAEPNIGKNGDEWIILTKLEDFQPLADVIANEESCQRAVGWLDEQGMTVEWQQAGCPYGTFAGKYGPDHLSVPLNEDGTIPATYDFDAAGRVGAWDEPVGVLPVYVGGVRVGHEEAETPKKKRKVATKAEKRGFFYQQEGTL